MENVRIIKTIKIILPVLAIFFMALPIKAYSPNTTHHGLTAEIIKFFEYHYPDKEFTDDEKRWLKNGSVDEDHDIRPMNHFYDPVYGRGLFGFLSSKIWSQDTIAQANRDPLYMASAGNITRELFSSDTDYSWDRAVYEYVYGDKKRAMEALGHTLHLVEDATVPDHTRNDPHPPYLDDVFSQASPYEGWTKQFEESNMNVADSLVGSSVRPILHTSLNEYFDKVAGFSNNNFFSKDTLDDYSIPNKDGISIRIDEQNFIQRNILEQDYFLVSYDLIRDLNNNTVKNYLFNDDKNEVIGSYWSILSKEAVKNGAGVVKLFFDEVEKEKNSKLLYEKNKSSLTRAKERVLSIFQNTDNSNLASANLPTFSQAIDSPAEPTDEGQSDDNDTDTEETPIVSESQEIPLATEDNEFEETTIPETPENIFDTAQGEFENDTGNNQAQSQNQSSPYPGFGGGGAPISSSSNTVSDVETTEILPEDSQDEEVSEPVGISITSPVDFSQVFISNSILFSGTSTPNATISNSYNSSTTTAGISGAWQTELQFEQGTSTISFMATLGEQSTSTPEYSLFVDSLGPELFFSIYECSNSIVSEKCILMEEDLINLAWGDSSGEVVEFILNLNGGVGPSTATTTTFSVEQDGVYEFSVSASDTNGNESSLSLSVEKISSPVIINEIAWSGTKADPSDEWIELYNRTAETIDLNGWILMALDGTPTIELSREILPNSYFLLERTSDDAISDITADITYGNDGNSFALNNKGEKILLKRGEFVVDMTPELNICGNQKWCGGLNVTGVNAKKISMERVDPDIDGSEKTNWGTAIGEFILNGTDRDGFNILGTPKAENSVSHLITQTGTLSEERILTKKFSPYIIGRDGFKIKSGGKLIVEAGVIIKFVKPNEPSLTIESGGELKTNGTEVEKVVLTSFLDREYGGEITGGDCSEGAPLNCPNAGDWKRIDLNSSAVLDMNHTIIRYGGKWFNGSPASMRTMITADSSSVSMDSVVIEKSKKHGLYISGVGSYIIKNSIFREMNIDNDSTGLYIDNTDIVLGGTFFEDNTIDIKYVGLGDVDCDNCENLITDPLDLFVPVLEIPPEPAPEPTPEVATSTPEV